MIHKSFIDVLIFHVKCPCKLNNIQQRFVNFLVLISRLNTINKIREYSNDAVCDICLTSCFNYFRVQRWSLSEIKSIHPRHITLHLAVVHISGSILPAVDVLASTRKLKRVKTCTGVERWKSGSWFICDDEEMSWRATLQSRNRIVIPTIRVAIATRLAILFRLRKDSAAFRIVIV